MLIKTLRDRKAASSKGARVVAVKRFVDCRGRRPDPSASLVNVCRVFVRGLVKLRFQPGKATDRNVCE